MIKRERERGVLFLSLNKHPVKENKPTGNKNWEICLNVVRFTPIKYSFKNKNFIEVAFNAFNEAH